MKKGDKAFVMVSLFQGVIDAVEVFADEKEAEYAHEQALDEALESEEVPEGATYEEKVSFFKDVMDNGSIDDEPYLYITEVK